MADLTWSSERYRQQVRDGVEYHTFVWPNDDMLVHDPYEWSCPCMPRYKVYIGVHVLHPGLCLCTLYELVHHSLDGRELSE